MPRYYFTLQEGDVRVEDLEGAVFATPRAVRDEACRAAREVMCAQLVTGRLDLGGYIEVADKTGAVVTSVAFQDAVMITGLGRRDPRRS